MNDTILIIVGVPLTAGVLAGWLAARTRSSWAWAIASIGAWAGALVLFWLVSTLYNAYTPNRMFRMSMSMSVQLSLEATPQFALLAIPAALISSFLLWVIVQFRELFSL